MSRIRSRIKTLERRQPAHCPEVLFTTATDNGFEFKGEIYPSTEAIPKPDGCILIVFKPTPPEAKQ
jgi:hypothetical protein